MDHLSTPRCHRGPRHRPVCLAPVTDNTHLNPDAGGDPAVDLCQPCRRDQRIYLAYHRLHDVWWSNPEAQELSQTVRSERAALTPFKSPQEARSATPPLPTYPEPTDRQP